jgi:hypothetical protein
MANNSIRTWGAALLLPSALSLGACHVKLVADYDDEFSKSAIAAEKEIDSLLENQRNPAKTTDISYEGNIAAYNQINVDLKSLLTRAMSHDNNEPSINQVKSLIETVDGLEAAHKRDGHLGAFEIDQKEAAIQAEISSIVRTENAKKAGA